MRAWVLAAAILAIASGPSLATVATGFPDGWCEQLLPGENASDVNVNLAREDRAAKATLIFSCVHEPDLIGPAWAIGIHAAEGSLRPGQIWFVLVKRDRSVRVPFPTIQVSGADKVVVSSHTHSLGVLMGSFEPGDVLVVSDGADVVMNFPAIPFLHRFVEAGTACLGKN
jgi:hypothetical protein